MAPLIAHVVYRLDVGGLENGVVNLLNELPRDRYRHAVICLTDYTDFARRIQRPDVALYALHKPAGNSVMIQPRLWKLFRELRPHVVHSRNLAALEAQAAAFLAGVPVRIHGEHGRDIGDLDGSSLRHQRVRRLFSPFVHQYIAVSRELADYLRGPVGIAAGRVAQIQGGVDTRKFNPRGQGAASRGGFAGDVFVVGTVGRMQRVKNPLLLARAFVRVLQIAPDARARLRLAMIGDGPLRPEVDSFLAEQGVRDLAWLPGSCDGIAEIMRGLDLFALPSLAEGTSNTLLEAMASGLPVVATDVGGTPDLVVAGGTGTLVASENVEAMARAIVTYLREPALAAQHGAAGRERAERDFSLAAQVAGYARTYDAWLERRGRRAAVRGAA